MGRPRLGCAWGPAAAPTPTGSTPPARSVRRPSRGRRPGWEFVLGELLAVQRLREDVHARLGGILALAPRHEVAGKFHELVIGNVQGFAEGEQDVGRGGL